MKGFNNWINNQKDDLNDKDLKRIWDLTSSYKSGYHPDVEARHSQFMQTIGSESSARVIPIRRSRNVWRYAAAIAVLIAAGLFWQHFVGTDTGQQVVVAVDITETNLLDGTEVTLNENSRIDVSDQYGESERLVRLTGEAFFDVARDEVRPFKVETENAVVEVLGTSFNVRSFPEEEALEVFVKSGSVKVFFKESGAYHLLSANDYLKVDYKGADTDKIADSSANAMAWKTGKLTFKRQPMGEIFTALEKQYSVEFALKDKELKDCLYTINLNASDLEDTFASLKAACGLEFNEKNKDEYEVIGSCCD